MEERPAAAAEDRQRARDRREAEQAQPPVDGQVIARWVAHGRRADEDSYAPAVAIYDGCRVWSFDVTPGVFAGVRLGPGTLYGCLARLEETGLVKALPPQERRQPAAKRSCR